MRVHALVYERWRAGTRVACGLQQYRDIENTIASGTGAFINLCADLGFGVDDTEQTIP